MTRQLTFLDPGTGSGASAGGPRRVHRPAWRIDERTRELGRRGVADARAALAAARRAGHDPGDDTADRTAA